jgi:hypothetical protein
LQHQSFALQVTSVKSGREFEAILIEMAETKHIITWVIDLNIIEVRNE